MKLNWGKWIALICIGIFGMAFFVACGGSGGDDDPPASIYGTYQLESFIITYRNGTVITQGDVDDFNGVMYIYPSNNITQSICLRIGSIKDCAVAHGVLINNQLVDRTSNGCEYRIPLAFDGYTLTGTLPMGTCGKDHSETEVWRKVSDSTPASAEENQDGYKGNIGAIIGELYSPSQ